MKVIADKTLGWQKAIAYLNGERMDWCTEADDVAGYVIVHVAERAPDGRVHFQLDEHGEPVTRMLSGNVEIRMNG